MVSIAVFNTQIADAPSFSSIDINDRIHESWDQDCYKTQLADALKNKDLAKIDDLGGVRGLADALQTNLESGIINPGDLNRRRAVFGSNTSENLTPNGLLYFVFQAFQDATILILMGCATLSLVSGIQEHGVREGWYEGGGIFLAVFLVVFISAITNYRREKQQFKNLARDDHITIHEVVREGKRQETMNFDIVVGDVVILNTGDQIPADGLFIDGDSTLLVDESRITGEIERINVDSSINPFYVNSLFHWKR